MHKENEEHEVFVGSLNFMARLRPKAAVKQERIFLKPSVQIKDEPAAILPRSDAKSNTGKVKN